MAEQLNGSTGIAASTAGGTRLAERPTQNIGGSAATSTSPNTPGTTGTMGTPGTPGTKPVPFAAVSFVSGLVGLLVANLVLGPLAIVLGAIGLRADKNRRVRATLGILLGVADIAVFLVLAAHSAHHGSVNWNFFGSN